MGPSKQVTFFIIFRYLHLLFANEISNNCFIRPCAIITPTGFENDIEKKCMWCGENLEALSSVELFALVGFSQSCAKSNNELVRPRNNWCIGHKTLLTLFDSDEKIGCEEDMITDPCSGTILQTSLDSHSFDLKTLDPWGGITCSKDGKHIREISFTPKTKLECQLGDFDLSPLTKLQTFDIAKTGISGNLLKAQWLMDMKQLKFLDLSKNRLSGSLNMLFGDELELELNAEEEEEEEEEEKGETITDMRPKIDLVCPGLCRLVRLDLAGNAFQGSIPNIIGALPHLQHIMLNQNSFTGSIPTILLEHQKLKQIDVRQNSEIATIQDKQSPRIRN